MRRLGWAALLAASLALTALAGWSARTLRIETRLVDVLPAGTPAAEDYRIFLERFGGIEKVFVVVEPGTAEPSTAEPKTAEPGAAPEATARREHDGDESLLDAAELIAERLGASRWVASAQAGLSAADERFFLEQVLPRAPLLAADEAAVAQGMQPQAVRERVRELRRRLRTPGGAAAARWLAADPLGLAALLVPPAGGVSAPVDPFTGAFVAADGSAALVVVDPVAAELDPEAGRELAAEIAAAVAAAESELALNLPAGLIVHAVGGPLYAAADETILRADLTRTLSGSALGVSLILLLAFRGPRVLLALLATVATGIVCTAGLAAVLLGSPAGAGGDPGVAVLSALAIGFGSILLGLGVDYGIHLAARQREKRLAGLAAGAAVLAAGRETAPAILASAATTGGAFLVLALASFRPVRELGLLVGCGVLVLLATTAAVGAPLLVLGAGRRLPPSASGRIWRGLAAVVEWTVGLGERRPRTVLAVAALLTLVAAAALPRLEFDADLRSLRPADHPMQEGEQRLAASFGVGLDTATLMIAGDDPQQALDGAARVAATLRDEFGGASGVGVSSPSDWLPGERTLALRSRRRGGRPSAAAAAALRDELAAQGLSPAPFAGALAVLDALAERRPPPPVPRERWPDWLAREVAPSAAGGALVAIRLSAPAGAWAAGLPPDLRSAIEAAAPGAPFASFQRLARELRSLLAGDLRRLGGLALLLVAILVLASFRGRPLPSALALLPVSLGLLWTLGACALAGVALDPFSLVVAPVLVGIGIDDGLHALHGARRAGGGSSGTEGVRAAGPAMALTTLTTAVGFGGLLASRLPALARGGLLVAGGTLLCLAATLLVIPAAEALRRPRRSPELPPHAPDVGRFARLLGPLRIDGVFWFRLHFWSMRHWPRPLFGPTIFLFTVLFWVVLRRIRAAVASNLEAVLGPCGWWESQGRIFRTLHQYAWCLSERYERLTGRPEVAVAVDQPERLAALAGAERGLVFVTGHLGSWEIGSAIPVERDGRRMHVVREEETDPRAQAFVAGLLRQAMGEGYVTHFAGASDPHLSMVLLAALRSGDSVALQGDRPRHGGKTIVRELFGRPYSFPCGPAVLARAAEAPIVPVFVVRQGRLSYRVHLGEPFEVARSGDRNADLAAAVVRLASELEAAIRRRPHQWFCFRKLWG